MEEKNLINQEKDFCPFTELINFVSKKWMLMIIKSISDWCKSFSEIEKNLTWANPRIISNRLKELQDQWFLDKKILSKSPMKIIYCLTEKWDSLSKHIESISKWAKKNMN